MRARSPDFLVKVGVARTVGRLSRLTGRGGGTTLPGRLLLKMEPQALERLGRGLHGPVTVVSATNGKTTTTSLLAGILADAGRRVVHNRAGSNMTWGVTTALVAQRGDEGLFEVDEAWLPRVADALSPDVFLLANLFRDQLDRHGELETLAEAWREMIEKHAQRPPHARGGHAGIASFVLNADDPRIADLARDERGEVMQNVIYFGIDDRSQTSEGPGVGDDPAHCRRCGSPYAYESRQLGHLGHYFCPECDLKRPEPEIVATKIEPRGMAGSTVSVDTPAGSLTVDLPLPGLYNVYNALAALAAAFALGADLQAAAGAIGASQAVFGRMERLTIDGHDATLLLIKNPTGATEVLRTLEAAAHGEGGLDLWLALNDGIADGRDVSWVWDADFERLSGKVRRVTCSGRRAEEMALRLRYAGWDADRIRVNRDLAGSFDQALAEAEGELYALPTYTALLDLRAILADRGLVGEYLA
jgi:UDP-N-acetylmuramyl tripeptide synthase